MELFRIDLVQKLFLVQAIFPCHFPLGFTFKFAFSYVFAWGCDSPVPFMFQLWFLEIPGNYTKCQTLAEICGVWQESAAAFSLTIKNGWSYF